MSNKRKPAQARPRPVATPAATAEEILTARKPREVSTQLVLDNELLDEWQNAQDDLAALEDTGGSLRLAGGTKKTSIQQAELIQSIEDRIEASAVKFTFRQTDPDTYQAICDARPPRDGNYLDLHAGYNRDAVLDECVAVCLVEPQMSREELAEFRKTLNPSEWKELRDTVDQVNGRVSQAPKSVLASRILSGRGSGSAPQGLGG
jgi:hypothetical protein